MNIKTSIISINEDRQFSEVKKILESNGFVFVGCVFKECGYIFANAEAKRFAHTRISNFGSEELTYRQFMEKYEMSNLKKKIEEAKKVTGLSASALSEKLGFQHKYLTNAVREASTQRQKEIIEKLDGLIFKEENELTHDFEGKALNVNIADAVMVSKAEYDGLKKELSHKTQVAEKHADMRNKSELRVIELENEVKLISEAHDILVNKKINLESQLKTTQEKFIDVVDQKDKEIKKLQNDCNHATNQYQGKRAQVVRLNEKVKKQASIYMIIIAILFIASIVGFAS